MRRALESRVKNYIARKSFLGINNASAILVNYKTMEVLAYIGSSDFFDDAIEVQVNGLAAYRSPGSTMKPFRITSAYAESTYRILAVGQRYRDHLRVCGEHLIAQYTP